MPARMCSRVVLPHPDGPITAIESARAMSRSTPSRARVVVPPVPVGHQQAPGRQHRGRVHHPGLRDLVWSRRIGGGVRVRRWRAPVGCRGGGGRVCERADVHVLRVPRAPLRARPPRGSFHLREIRPWSDPRGIRASPRGHRPPSHTARPPRTPIPARNGRYRCSRAATTSVSRMPRTHHARPHRSGRRHSALPAPTLLHSPSAHAAHRPRTPIPATNGRYRCSQAAATGVSRRRSIRLRPAR